MSTPGVATCPPGKARLARALGPTRALRAARLAEARRPGIRVLNLHSVPARFEGSFRSLLAHLLERYEPLDPFLLERALEAGGARGRHLVLTFDDGLANHAEVVAPVLEEHGLRGVFCVPARFPDVPAAEQLAWFRSHVYPRPTELHLDGDIGAMSWEQLRSLAARGHRICSHSLEHLQISASTARGPAEREIVESRAMLIQRLGGGVPVDGFCWPIRFDRAAHAADALVRATYRYALCGESQLLRPPHDRFRAYRTNVEVSWPLDVVDLQLSGLADAWFSLRRLAERRRR